MRALFVFLQGAFLISTHRTLRDVSHLEAGHALGPISRLVSPSDLGEQLKPFIFLDYFNATIEPGFGFPMHPHSGIATLTWQPGTDVAYQDTTGQHGVLKAGGLEWMNAGGGAWHKASLMGSGHVSGFQLWVAMPPGVESGPAQGQYVAPDAVPVVAVPAGPTHHHKRMTSPLQWVFPASPLSTAPGCSTPWRC